jgi:hypothetical protein
MNVTGRYGKPRVFISGPMAIGHRGTNLRSAIAAADRLIEIGCTPHVPHLSWFWDDLSPHPYEEWMQLDFEWIAVCDALLRLPGESTGADRECAFAREEGLPVFEDIDSLAECFGIPL